MQEYLKFGCIELIYERIPAKKNFTIFLNFIEFVCFPR